jgi:hypothetical protein
MFPNLNIFKFTRKSPDGRTRDQIDRTLLDRRWHSSILDIGFVRGGNRYGDHYLMVATFRERMGVSKRVEQKGNK